MEIDKRYGFSQTELGNIKKSYLELCAILKGKGLLVSIKEETLVEKAFYEAYHAHQGQTRKSGEPYVLHPLEVAKICCTEINLGITSIVCALLHDVVEDTEVKLEEIRTRFGNEVCTIVDGLTKLDGSYKTISIQAENFKKIIGTMIYDVRVVLIKLADRLHNLRTIDFLSNHKQLKIAAETKYIYAPLAYRLGLYNLKINLDDLCLKITDKDFYNEINRRIEESDEERSKYIKSFISPLKTSLNRVGIKNRIYGRIKSISSIANKIKTKFVTFDEVYDMFAIRIVIDTALGYEKETCWRVYSIVTDTYAPVTERLRDWLSVPKSNGYESLHTTIVGPEGKFVEVQIRTERMEEIAEKGYATHWKYKGLKPFGGFDRWLDNVKDIIENKDSSTLEILSDFKTSLFKDEVFVYTPKGDMKVLPKGATALDFAFAIHTDIGSQCTAIKINNKLVPMGYKLQNGDKIYVTTNKNQKPKENWLKMVVTGRAKSKIRSALKEDLRQQGAFAKEALERKFKNLKIDFSEPNIETLIKFKKLKSHVDFYFEISNGKIDINDLLKNFEVEHGKLALIKEETPITVKEELEQIRVTKPAVSKSGIFINGEPAEHYKFSLATCCNPVNGDDIFGYVSNTGLKIHRSNCPNSTNLMARYGYRVLKAEWNDSSANTDFTVILIITGVDKGVGVIENISGKISSGMGLNIRSFHIDGNEGYFEGKIKLHVKDKNQLYLVIKALKELEGISSVTRVE